MKPQANVDLIRDFVAIGQTGNSVYALCASKESGARDLAETIKLAKAKPGEMKIGSVGIGSAHHLIAEMLKSAASIELTHVPYRGEAPAIPDLVAGRIDLMFLTTAKPLIDEGRVAALGHTGNGPWFQLPQLKPLTLHVHLREGVHLRDELIGESLPRFRLILLFRIIEARSTSASWPPPAW